MQEDRYVDHSWMRLIAKQSALVESVVDLQRSHDSLNASLAAMEQSNDEWYRRIEQLLVDISSWQRCFKDCQDYRSHGLGHTNRIITTPGGSAGACNQETYCDMETDGGGWTVFQRHQSDDVNFTRNWADYKHGFGHVNGDFWWGNDKLAQALNDGRQYELRIDMLDRLGYVHRYANSTLRPKVTTTA